MTHGVVLGGQAIVPLALAGGDGRSEQIDFVLDTGFAGFLSLPAALISSLRLTWLNQTLAILAGNVAIEADAYEAALNWKGEEVAVEVLALDGNPLLGMAQLRGCEIRLQVEDGGIVEIEPP